MGAKSLHPKGGEAKSAPAVSVVSEHVDPELFGVVLPDLRTLLHRFHPIPLSRDALSLQKLKMLESKETGYRLHISYEASTRIAAHLTVNSLHWPR